MQHHPTYRNTSTKPCLTWSGALSALSHDDELATEVTEASGHEASLLEAMRHVDLEALLQILQGKGIVYVHKQDQTWLRQREFNTWSLCF